MTTTRPYLARSLQQSGYTGTTGTTPYKPATADQINGLQDACNGPAKNAPPVVASNATVF